MSVAPRRAYRIGDVSRMAGVSIRTLHYYDEIGLLVPRARTDSGYRLYTDDDLLRLQQILIGRELGLPLEEIRRSLDDPSFDPHAALLEQRRQLQRRAADTAAMIAAVDAALAIVSSSRNNEREGCMDTIFGGFDPSNYEEEARERWGSSDAYKEASRRTQRFTKEDWKRQTEEQNGIYAEAAALMRAGTGATADAAMAVAERHRLLIDRWFYPCSHAMHRGLADMYETDERFTASIDRYGTGLTTFLAAAIRANADRQDDSTAK